MDKNMFYEPFITKFEEWVEYYDNMPAGEYMENIAEHEAFRATHDRDCVLTGGNLNADTIFSLWLPIRHTISRINTREAIAEVGDMNNKFNFSRKMLENDNLYKLLPYNNSVVLELRELVVLGLGRCNVMILPQRWLNSTRGCAPYYDYMPRFLYELFPGGDFDSVFKTENDLVTWIESEKLNAFFDGPICRENVKDLCGSGDMKKSIAPRGAAAQKRMIHNYCEVLRARNALI